MKTKEEKALDNFVISQSNKGNIKKITIPNQPVKLEDHVKELISYTKEQVLKDATEYLTNLTKINEEVNISRKNLRKKTNELIIEVEESDGLKLIKLDSFKLSYYFHLEIKSNYN